MGTVNLRGRRRCTGLCGSQLRELRCGLLILTDFTRRQFYAKAGIVALVPLGRERQGANVVGAGNEEPSGRVLPENAVLVREI